jgi:hypothetical protein
VKAIETGEPKTGCFAKELIANPSGFAGNLPALSADRQAAGTARAKARYLLERAGETPALACNFKQPRKLILTPYC